MRPLTLAEWRAGGERVLLRGGLSVFRRVAGPTDGETWTLLHGWPTTSWDWAPVAPALEAKHRTLVLDWPGLGASDKGDGVDYSIDALTDVVVALWDREGVGMTRLVAHDVGTIVAQELLARQLDGALDVEIRSVAWLNGSLHPDLYEPTDVQLALADPAIGPDLAAAITGDVFAAGLADVHHPDHRPSPATLAEHWEAFGGSEATSEMPRFLGYMEERSARSGRLVAAVERTSIPQRFIWGLADAVSGRAQAERLRDRLGSGIDLVAYEDCGHYPHLERPDDVARELLRPW